VSTASSSSSSAVPLYEVRVYAWNCTCASFAFSVYSNARITAADNDVVASAQPSRIWGGYTLDGGGACKHLVACVLAEHCEALFGGFVVEEEATRERMAELAVVWD
jgi:hypothetical protein